MAGVKNVAAGFLFILLILMLGIGIGRKTVEVRVVTKFGNLECEDGPNIGKVSCFVAEAK